ncbi:hypothetical protein DB30_06814 [Enhygromyxa salina]|uniref:DUF1684 domain-containing protein n=2 Tax=Enhygromyxa salina TaxID=215803 RepID=A0A0C2CTI1_9BACT|nr:hypothetical protein DB30_06814 [Enhygromyxa salina]
MTPLLPRRSLWLAALAALAVACTVAEPRTDSAPPVAAPPPTADPAALERARAFQLELDRELREDDRSFLTVVAAYYLAPGEQLKLARFNGSWGPPAKADDAAQLSFEATPEQLLVTGIREATVRETTLIPLGDGDGDGEDSRFAVAISPQSESWRVQIHDRDAELRASFPGVAWFPIDGAVIVTARFEPSPTREGVLLQTSRGLTKTLYVVGEAHFEINGQALSLQAFGYAPTATPNEPLLIPFRDQTSGHQSYAAGRYLELQAPTGTALELDFNRATNPLCAYSEHFNCPVPPRNNTLEVAIRAGAGSPTAH